MIRRVVVPLLLTVFCGCAPPPPLYINLDSLQITDMRMEMPPREHPPPPRGYALADYNPPARHWGMILVHLYLVVSNPHRVPHAVSVVCQSRIGDMQKVSRELQLAPRSDTSLVMIPSLFADQTYRTCCWLEQGGKAVGKRRCQDVPGKRDQ